MSKKSFKNNLNDIFQPTQPEINPPKPTVEKSIPDDGIIKRTTLLIKEEKYETIKAIAYWERKQISEIVQKGLDAVINEYDPKQLSEIVRLFESS